MRSAYSAHAHAPQVCARANTQIHMHVYTKKCASTRMQVVALAPGWQAWQAAGRPLMEQGIQRLPSHGYAMPAIDASLLQQGQHGQEQEEGLERLASSSGRRQGAAAVAGKAALASPADRRWLREGVGAAAGGGSGGGTATAVAEAGAAVVELDGGESGPSSSSSTLYPAATGHAAAAGCGDEALACELPFWASVSSDLPLQGQQQGLAGGAPGSAGPRDPLHLPEAHSQQQFSEAPSPSPYSSCGDEDIACELPNLSPLPVAHPPPPHATSDSAADSEAEQGSGDSSFLPSCGDEDMACELPNPPPPSLPLEHQGEEGGNLSGVQRPMPSCGDEDTACELPNLPPLPQ